jgi:RimJ/RimL family protein N-acetyltransferase
VIQALIAASWDRPEMTQDGADPKHVGYVEAFQYFLIHEAGRIIGMLVGMQQSMICIEMHCVMLPGYRGKTAVRALRAFGDWLRTRTRYRKVVAQVPAYNRPMLHIAARAGMTRAGLNRESVMRGGRLYDQVIFEKGLHA